MSQTLMWMLIVCGAIQVAVLVIWIVYVAMVRTTRHWSQANGTVITSRVVSRRMGNRQSHTDLTHTPFVEYEYRVNDRKYCGSRIMIGGGQSEVELEGVLNRYPLGANVVVFYNPADPQQAVLQREIPAARLWGCGTLMLFPLGVPLVAIAIYQHAGGWLTALAVVDPYALCIGFCGLATLAYAIVMAAVSMRASAWPTTRGRIATAGEEKLYNDDDDGFTTKYSVTYEYEVNGRHYRGGRVRAAFPFSSNISWLSKRALARYPVREEVDVHYNPKDPRQSVLHPWSAGQAVSWLIAAGLLALAWELGK